VAAVGVAHLLEVLLELHQAMVVLVLLRLFLVRL